MRIDFCARSACLALVSRALNDTMHQTLVSEWSVDWRVTKLYEAVQCRPPNLSRRTGHYPFSLLLHFCRFSVAVSRMAGEFSDLPEADLREVRESRLPEVVQQERESLMYYDDGGQKSLDKPSANSNAFSSGLLPSGQEARQPSEPLLCGMKRRHFWIVLGITLFVILDCDIDDMAPKKSSSKKIA